MRMRNLVPTHHKQEAAVRNTNGRKVTDQAGIMAEQMRFYKELYSKVPNGQRSTRSFAEPARSEIDGGTT